MCKQLCKLKIITLIICIALFQFCNIDVDAASSKINKTKATIYVGKTLKLKVSNAKKVKWSSTKKSVATVNSKGKVTAKKAGKCTIKAKVGKKTYKCKLTVKKPYLNNTSAEMSIDDNLKLKLTGATAKSWKSSNPDSVYVSSKGIVIALDEGSVIVTCTDTKRRKYECVITVLPDEAEDDDSDYDNDTTDDNSDTDFDDIGVHEHSYSKKIIKEPTCVEKGSYKLECSCGDFTTHTLEPTGHDYISTVVEPTCTEVGYTEHVCDYCSDTYKDTEVEALGHDYKLCVFDDSTLAEAATCVSKATYYYHCTRCDSIDKSNKSEHGDLSDNHYYNVITMVPKYLASKATCDEPAKYYYYCGLCDFVDYNQTFENGNALGHDYQSCVFDDTTLALPATCSHIAQYYYHCTRCDSIDTTQKSGHGSYDKSNHNYDVVKMIPTYLAKEASCTKPARYYYHCLFCGEPDTTRTFESGKANGHDYALSRQLSGPDTLVNKATCVTLESHYYKCYNCGLIDKTRTYSEGGYTDHDYGYNITDEALSSKADCTHPATYYKSCNVCGKVNNRSEFDHGNALGHIKAAVPTTNIPSTFSTKGRLVYKCSRCFTVMEDRELDYCDVPTLVIYLEDEHLYENDRTWTRAFEPNARIENHYISNGTEYYYIMNWVYDGEDKISMEIYNTDDKLIARESVPLSELSRFTIQCQGYMYVYNKDLFYLARRLGVPIDSISVSFAYVLE